MAVVVSDNAVPFGTDDPLNRELAETWKDMADRIAEMSQGRVYDENLKVDNVLENLNAVQSGHQKKSEKWGSLKNTFSNALTVISNVGGMIAEATSQVSSMNSKKERGCGSFDAGVRPGRAMLQCPQLCHQRVQELPKHIRCAQ